MTHRAPVRIALASVFMLVLSSATFHAQSTQPKHTLTFAELTYGTSINAMIAAPGGGAWFGGRTCATSLPTTTNAIQRTKSGGCHGVIGKVMPNGAVVYLSYLGGGADAYDYVTALALDAAGNLYVGGQTDAPDFPVTSDAYDASCGDDGTCKHWKSSEGNWLYMSTSDVFVAKLSPHADRILYSTFVGGADDDHLTGLAVDATGRIHMAGSTLSLDFPVTPSALKTAYEGTSDMGGNPITDAFYARLSPDARSLQYGTYLGGGEAEDQASLAIDSAGNAYVAGSTKANDLAVQNAVQPTNASADPYPYISSDGWLARFGDSAVYSTYVGGDQNDFIQGVAVVGDDVYLAGETCSSNFPGAPNPGTADCRAFIATGSAATGAVQTTVTLQTGPGLARAQSLVVDANRLAYITGVTTGTYPTTPDAHQTAYGGGDDAFLSIVDFGVATPTLRYSTDLGAGDDEQGYAVAPDGAGGVYFGGYATWPKDASPTFPEKTTDEQPNVEPVPSWQTRAVRSFAAHVAAVNPGAGGSDIVLYARDAATVAGAWQLVSDSTAAGGTRAWLPDAGAAKLSSASATPANYVDLTFDAPAGVPYQLWLRMKADGDSWQNDSVFVQFSDVVDPQGFPRWQIGTSGATVVSLEDCSGCGERGWGWNDNGYSTSGVMVTFATSGTHTIRIQQREDGISIDQIVLSSAAYVTTPPGANKDDDTILAQPTTAPPDTNEIVKYATDAANVAGSWQFVEDGTAAGATRLFNPDAGTPKITTAAAAPGSYFDVTFNAQAGVPYHLWLRMTAQNDSWTNDSVFVQFSDSVDGSGNPVWRIGSTSATVVSLEDCSGCGEQAWGWNDNGYNSAGVLVTFATGGTHTIRVQQREDGVSIDQIVLSAVKYLSSPPGAAKNDTTIVPR